ncbi:hypothetical protein BC835DRAFT_1332945 [Cytidiella melzeri]|nr:hypothetical protein BC835DRAFT_1332945 [Cytidiella melzeri]
MSTTAVQLVQDTAVVLETRWWLMPLAVVPVQCQLQALYYALISAPYCAGSRSHLFNHRPEIAPLPPLHVTPAHADTTAMDDASSKCSPTRLLPVRDHVRSSSPITLSRTHMQRAFGSANIKTRFAQHIPSSDFPAIAVLYSTLPYGRVLAKYAQSLQH